jgi:hypothetical protein
MRASHFDFSVLLRWEQIAAAQKYCPLKLELPWKLWRHPKKRPERPLRETAHSHGMD